MQCETKDFEIRCTNTRETFVKAVTRHKAPVGQFEYDLQSYLFLDSLSGGIRTTF